MTAQPYEILTIGEAAPYLKTGKCAVYRLASGGTAPAFKLGATCSSRRAEVDQWIARRIGDDTNQRDGE